MTYIVYTLFIYACYFTTCQVDGVDASKVPMITITKVKSLSDCFTLGQGIIDAQSVTVRKNRVFSIECRASEIVE